MKRKTSVLIIAAFFILPQMAAAVGYEEDAAFIAKRLSIVGLEVGSVKPLGNSVFLVTIKSFTKVHDVLRLKSGISFKPFQIKAKIIGKNLKLARTPLLEAGFQTTVPSGERVILSSGVVVEKRVIRDDDEGGLMIDDD